MPVWMNDVVMWILVIFMCVGVIDKLQQNKWGYGKAFEEGFMAMGPLALSMIGIISLSPVLANVLRPIITPVFTFAGADPAMFPGILLAIDMGGYPLAMELGETEMAGQFAGIIVATLIGPTFVFTIPVALSLIKKHDESIFAKGILIGLIPVPIGALAGGISAGFPISFLIVQIIPIILFSGVIIAGLLFLPSLMIRGFVLFGKGIVSLIIIALAFTIIEALTGVTIIQGMLPLSEGVEIVGIIAITLAGAFPLVHFLKQRLASILPPIAEKLSVKEISLIGLISSLAHSIPMFKLMHSMDEKGKLINIAFAVSGAFVLGGHLGFTASVETEMILPMMLGKIIAGILAILVAFIASGKRNEYK